MQLSLLIPTVNRPAKLAACLSALTKQSISPSEYEVLIGIDGPDQTSIAAAKSTWASHKAHLEIVPCPKAGLNATRNAALRKARGRYLISINDDILPEPTFLEAHLRAHQAAESKGKPAIISGYSPFIDFPNPTLFDRLAQHTSMLFFYDQMLGQKAKPANHDWGFRHCWGLNFSAPLAAVREVGAFTAIPMLYGYDDIEIAWRLHRRYQMPVLFVPEARADHDHRYQPRDIIKREYNLGLTAWHFAELNPGFAQDVFKRDIRSAAELAYSREFIAREESAAKRLEQSFLDLADIPASSIEAPHSDGTSPHTAPLLNLIYEQHLLLKRYHWRRGLLAASAQSGR